MENVLSHLRHLSSEELRDEAKRAGLNCGPITKSTRSFLEKKLARLIVAMGQERTDEIHHGDDEPDVPGSENMTLKKTAEGKIIGKEDEMHRRGGLVEPDKVPETNEPERLQGSQADIVSRRQNDRGEIENGGRQGSKDVGEEENVKKCRECGDVDKKSLMEVVAVTNGNDSSISPPSGLFYGVCPAPGSSECGIEGTKDGVYTDRTLALCAVRALPGSRFKAFSSWEKAHDFASSSLSIANSPNRGSMIEQANSFCTPRVQDLTTKLRQAAERGDIDELYCLAWGNPCYLIGPGDVPTIVQVGCRYNALHVAAKAGQADFIHHLLLLISLPSFLTLAFPFDSSISREQRAARLTDLYLNTPEKGKFDTPLHLAAEFGHLAVVRLLLSHPSLVCEPRNRCGSTPLQVICSRKEGASESLREQLKQCFEGQVFVPLLRAEENTTPPVIAPPCSPSHNFNPLSPTRTCTTTSRNPCKPSQQLQAFAGPMSPAKAENFRKNWKKCKNTSISDPERGAETVGRNLAHSEGFPWTEYWEFLDRFTDFSSPAGLSILECHLNSLTSQHTSPSYSSIISSDSSTHPFSDSPSRSQSHTSLCCPGQLHLPSGISPLPRKKEPVVNLVEKFKCLSFGNDPQEDEEDHCNDGKEDKDVVCLVNNYDQKRKDHECGEKVEKYTAMEVEAKETGRRARNEKEVNAGPEETGEKSNEVELEAEQNDLCGLPDPRRPNLFQEESEHLGGCEEKDGQDQVNGCMERGRVVTFLTGPDPCKLDLDVYAALVGASVDPTQFPRVSSWMHLVSSYALSQHQ